MHEQFAIPDRSHSRTLSLLPSQCPEVPLRKNKMPNCQKLSQVKKHRAFLYQCAGLARTLSLSEGPMWRSRRPLACCGHSRFHRGQQEHRNKYMYFYRIIATYTSVLGRQNRRSKRLFVVMSVQRHQEWIVSSVRALKEANDDQRH